MENIKITNISLYIEKLNNIIYHILDNNLSAIEIMNYNNFNELEINQDILNDAYLQNYNVKYKLKNILLPSYPNILIDTRKFKKIERILEKKKNIKQDINFKINSDFIGFRIKCDISDIYKIIDLLRNKFDLFFERNSILYEDKYIDIITYCYAYDYKTKYLIELQIGHPFAMYVFERDSFIRDNKNCGLIDLWDNDFYINVKHKLLRDIKYNNYNIVENLKILYKDKEIEKELLNIFI